MIRRTALLVALVMVAAACQGQSERDSGLLAVVDDAGDLVLFAGDGKLVRQVTELNDQASVFQPIWSGPESVVYVEQHTFSGDLVMADTEGSELRRVEFITAPFYAYPDPVGGYAADIVTLRNHVEGGLAAEVVHEDRTVSVLEGSFPYYFTWMPDQRVVAHSGAVSLGEAYPDRLLLTDSVGTFAAPGSRDNEIIFVRSSGSTSLLTVLSDGELRDLASIRGPANLVVGDDRVAVRSLRTDLGGGSIEARAQTIPAIPPDALAVVGLDDAEVEIVATGGVLGFFWDPTGTRLLYLVVEDADRGQLQWRVWEDGTSSDYGSFGPDPSWFATFAPFFDQYAQSMTLWAPDGTAFAYPGTVDGETGIWVQRLGDESPQRISSGSWVAWGPGGSS